MRGVRMGRSDGRVKGMPPWRIHLSRGTAFPLRCALNSWIWGSHGDRHWDCSSNLT